MCLLNKITLELRVIQTLDSVSSGLPESILFRLSSPNVDSRVEGRLGRLRLVGGGVDGGQGRLRARDLAGLSGLFSFGSAHCG